MVFQDCRGTFRSDGAFTPLADELADGADTVAWLGRQPWCDGTIGSFGASYLGITQWATASQAPAGLRAIAPAVTTTDYYTSPYYSDGGAMSLHLSLWWSTIMAFVGAQRSLAAGTAGAEALTEIGGALADLETRLAAMPVGDQPALGTFAPWWQQWLQHPDRDEFWQALSVAGHAGDIEVPAPHVGGCCRQWHRGHRDRAAALGRAGQPRECAPLTLPSDRSGEKQITMRALRDPAPTDVAAGSPGWKA